MLHVMNSEGNHPERLRAGGDQLLAVDLDHTLVRTDLLLEVCLQFVKRNPLNFFRLLGWAAAGRIFLKERLSEAVEVQADCLPYRQELLALVTDCRSRGQTVVLATASHQRWALKVAQHLQLFDHVLGSGEGTNLKGSRKLERLRERFPGVGIAYAGDSSSDLSVWQGSQRAIAVNVSTPVLAKLKTLGIPVHEIRDRSMSLRTLLRMIRVHQWSKNLLLFIPLIGAHHFLSWPHWSAAGLGFLSFSLLASSIYILNDLLDLESDRRHATKRSRPLACGEISIPWGVFAMAALFGASALTASFLPGSFTGMLGLYLVANLAYSFRIKRVLMLDVVFLASLYALRVLAGGVATGVPVSEWLMTFSSFLFFGLALGKRYIEISRHVVSDDTRLGSRDYGLQDKVVILILGAASSFLSVLVLTLYMSSPDVRRLYAHPERLWMLCPLMLYWISRLWALIHRKEVHDDPVLFAMKDPVTWGAAGVFLAILLVSM